ncbi:MAG: hypothetical protein IJX01_05920 [Oscillospiraceae bacterium]|nr:hypothetical protein [Oscillospiraceae bacterium]
MFRKKVIWEQLTGERITEDIIGRLEEMFEDFPQVRNRYLSAMEKLTKTQGTATATEMDAINSQLQSLVLFSGMLGLKANLDHFIDPVARNFLDVDTEVYLREETSHRLPEYKNSKRLRDEFFNRLSPEEKEIYDAVMEYTCYLETVAPKLAHYYGYLLGNELLPQVFPGYHPDTLQTARYEAMLSQYWGNVKTDLRKGCDSNGSITV